MDLILHAAIADSPVETYRVGFDVLPISVGRAPSSTVVLNHPTVSRRHCQLELDPGQTGGIVLRDMGSRGGTYLNGHRVTSSPVRGGDVFRLGSAVLRLELAQTPKPDASTAAHTDTDRLPTVGSQLTCEMCGRGMFTDELGSEDQQLADGRLICAVCGAHQSSLPGFGPLRFLRPMGQGGCGTVYKALHTKWRMIVAVKEVAFGDACEDASLARVLREIRIGLRLRHPAIVKLHEAPTDGSSFFLVMDYVEGQDLDQAVKDNGPLPLKLAARLARDLAGALDHAHQQKVVHRDIKPRNVVIKFNGQAVLTDFALARSIANSNLHSLSGTGDALGSPYFMSPEQTTDAKNVGPAADLYSLAATLYYALGGKPPYHDTTTLSEFFEAVNNRSPEVISRWRRDLPPAASAALMVAMEHDPEARPSVAGEWVEAFAGPLEQQSGL